MSSTVRFPDFYLVGAMKAGTTSLHRYLTCHPDVYIPDGEVYYFDSDDIIEHRDFFLHENNVWKYRSYEPGSGSRQKWYMTFYSDARPEQIWGDHSTTYLSAAKTAPRIQKANPAARIVIMLRNPVERAYSNYWHLVATGRTCKDFESHLMDDPYSVLHRSMYASQVAAYYEAFPSDQVHVVMFEEFRKDPVRETRNVAKFIRVPPSEIDPHECRSIYKKSPSYRSVRFQRFINGLRRPEMDYATHLGLAPSRSGIRQSLDRFLRGFTIVNRTSDKPLPLMKAETYSLLREVLDEDVTKLSRLISKDLESIWFSQ